MNVDELIKKAQIEQFENNNFVEAERLFLLAAEMGSGHAAHELGVLYATNGCGFEQSLEKSQYWYQKSLELGFESTIASDPEWFKKNS